MTAMSTALKLVFAGTFTTVKAATAEPAGQPQDLVSTRSPNSFIDTWRQISDFMERVDEPNLNKVIISYLGGRWGKSDSPWLETFPKDLQPKLKPLPDRKRKLSFPSFFDANPNFLDELKKTHKIPLNSGDAEKLEIVLHILRKIDIEYSSSYQKWSEPMFRVRQYEWRSMSFKCELNPTTMVFTLYIASDSHDDDDKIVENWIAFDKNWRINVETEIDLNDIQFVPLTEWDLVSTTGSELLHALEGNWCDMLCDKIGLDHQEVFPTLPTHAAKRLYQNGDWKALEKIYDTLFQKFKEWFDKNQKPRLVSDDASASFEAMRVELELLANQLLE